MVLPVSNQPDVFSNESESISNLGEFEPQIVHNDNQEIWEEDTHYEEAENNNSRDFSQNQMTVTFSWSLMNQMRQLARHEGISIEDLLTELVAEGVTKRAFEDQNKTMPSHLMTRNGYVHNNNDLNAGFSQPQMSHHAIAPNRNQNSNQQNRNKNTPQRNNSYNNRYPNSQNRNYVNNAPNGNNVNNGNSFRQNRNTFQNQQRFVPRQSQNVQTGNEIQNPRFDAENVDNSKTLKNKRY